MNIFRPILLGLLLLAPSLGFANIPGGGTGTGAAVTLTDNGTTVTMANGIVSIVITKADASIHSIAYTYNNTGTVVTNQLLQGGTDGGQLYWTGNPASFGNMSFTYSLVTDPSTNGGSYAEISLVSSYTTGIMEIHYSMLKGSPGFYCTPILTHRSTDSAVSIIMRPNIYAGSQFNWMSVDAARNRLMEVASSSTSIAAVNAPKECYLWTNGIYQGRYDDKYKYSADLGAQRVWGWSSVGTGGTNVGLWNVSASVEYYPGGPMERSLMEHIGTTILNVFTGNYYGLGSDTGIAAGEVWTKTYGPYFYYCNNVASTVTDPVQASQALYNDALAQGAAEQTAWPYSWFSNSNYVAASGRGTVTGKMAINDSGNPNASAANMWVGVVQQPSTTYDTVYDFQEWGRPYQYWVKTDANGNFSIPNVIAGTNYTLYAFGPGANGLFMSQAQTGGSPPITFNLPATPFAVSVTGGATTSLGTVTWTPTRVAPTVFEIGYPDRTAGKFRHGDDYWVGDIGPSATSPSPVWTKFLEYPFDFPNGPNYTVGSSQWPTGWNFIQPAVVSNAGVWNNSTSTITFSLPAGTAVTGTASLYLGLCSDYYAAIIVTLNGHNLSGVSGLSATPTTSVPSTGYYVGYGSSDTSIREGNNGAFSDERLTFPVTSSLLNTGTTTNTISIGIRQVGGGYFANHAMYDYVRFELTGYVPPAPGSVSAFAGNNCALVSWPVTPGATSYNVLRSTTSGSGYTSIATNVLGPVCGSGPANATYVDTTAVNGTPYYYVVQSVNPTGTSAISNSSGAATPSASIAAAAPAAPSGLTTTPGNAQVALNWTASSGANLYTVQRSTMVANGGGTNITLGTTTLSNTVTGTSFTDTTPTNGSIYSYTVSAQNAAGSSANSTASSATPLAPAPTSTVTNLATVSGTTSTTLTWSAVAGAVGYVIQEATSANGTYSVIGTTTETTFYVSGLSGDTNYYFTVTPMNSGGTATTSSLTVLSAPVPPATLTATPGNARVILSWTASAGATSYTVERATVTGGPYAIVSSAATGTSYTDIGLANGTAYYYVVAANDSGGTGDLSSEATATPTGPPQLVWTGTVSTAWDTATANWTSGGVAAEYSDGSDVFFDDTASTSTVVLSTTVIPDAVTFTAATSKYTLSGTGTISGTTQVNLNGTGTVTINNTNSYTGGTFVNAGTLALGATGSTGATAGTGTIQLSAGTALSMSSAGHNFCSNPVLIPSGANATLATANASNGYSGPAFGAASSTLTLSGAMSFSATGTAQLASFPGTVVIPSGSSLRFSSTSGANGNGGSSAAFQVNGTVNTRNTAGTGGVVLGALSGTGTLSGQTNTPTGSVTYVVGGANIDSTFSGIFANGSNGTAAVTKVGSGALTLTGSNTYTGATAVSAGTLIVNGKSGTGSVTVSSGATLAGTGTISGSSALAAGSTLSPGGSATGTLTFAAGFQLNATGTITFGLGAVGSSDVVALSGGTYTAPVSGQVTLNLTGLTGFGAGTYPVITGATGISAASFVVGTAPSGYAYTLSASGGTLSITVTPPPAAPTNLKAALSGSAIALNWTGSAGATGYLIERGTLSGGPYSSLGTSTTATYTDSSATSGTYYYVVAATNIAGQSGFSNEASASSLSAFQQWLAANNLPTSTSPDAMPDNDGVPLLLKYATAMTPGTPSAAGPAAITGTGTYLTLQFNRLSPAPVNYIVESTTDTSSWTPLASLAAGTATWTGTGAVAETGATPVQVTVTDTVSLATLSAPRFLRLRVTTASDTTNPGTVPQGAVPVTITGTTTNAVSIALDYTPVSRNAIAAVNGTSTLTVVNAGTWVGTTTPYALRLLSGSGSGATFAITAQSGNVLTLTTQGVDLTQLVAVGDLYEILPLDTLGSLFGTTATELQTGGSAASADNLLIWNGTTWLTYFNNGTNWMRSGSLVSQSNQPMPLGQGFLVVRRPASGITFNSFGRVPEVALQQFTTPGGYSFLSGAYPVAGTLGATGFASNASWLTGGSASSADNVLIWNGSTWLTYFNNGTNWLRSGSFLNQNSFALPVGQPLMIFRRSTPTANNALITQPLLYTP